MKRMTRVLTGMMIFTGAVILLITGCTAENPVSPAIEGGDSHYSPGTEAILIQTEISGDMIGDDLMTIESMEKLTPEIVPFPYDDPVEESPGVHVDDHDFIEQDFTR